MQRMQLNHNMVASQQFQNIPAQNGGVKRNNQIVGGTQSSMGNTPANIENQMRQTRYSSQNNIRHTQPTVMHSDLVANGPILNNSSNAHIGNQPVNQKKPGNNTATNQSDIYKVYLNYMPNSSGDQPKISP